MNKVLARFSSIVSCLAILIIPASALATDRVVATFPNGDIYMKEGTLGGGQWHQLTGGVNVGNLSVAGDRISLLDAGNIQKPVSIKEPAWNSQFNWVYWTDGGAPAASDEAISKLSNNTYRLLVQRVDGSIVMKDGPYNTGWWSGTLTLPGVASKMVVGGDNIGVITSGGDFYAKQLTPGQFSHPNNTPWQLITTNVLSVAMNNNLIAVEDNGTGNVYVKEGGITAGWAGNHAVVYNNLLHSGDISVGGSRLCALKASHLVECKEGSMVSQSIPTWSGGVSMDVSSTRVVVRSTDLINTYALEGTLLGANSGWQWITSDHVTQVSLNNK